ncbi:hypothetical protein LWM68_06820 [Niabella sp. W65]|nr:hypothetical protein [Niabella sp. W65]MCH7362507.1 hypothetical protein [Niabella sp. W65]ULT38463.1 hypothetical protein KRR40_25470 [Niabella sp. I65]
MESLQNEQASTVKTLDKLRADETAYKSALQLDKDGVKVNLIKLDNISSSDIEAIGKQIIKLYQDWKPTATGEHTAQVGTLYGFNLYIRRQQEAYEENGVFEYRYSNSFYAQRDNEGIKYTYNNGLPNTDNPKLAARHFLNAIDRVESLKDKYEHTLADLTTAIPKLEQLTTKPFLQEAELSQMKNELANLERQIAIKIQENQLKQQQVAENHPDEVPEVPVIHLNEKINGPTVPKEVILATQQMAERPRSRMRL